MPKPEILSDQELFDLTSEFQKNNFQKDRALELVAAATMSMLVEPGDRMAGALARSLGRLELIELMIEGLETKAVLSALNNVGELEACRQSFGDLESTLADSRQRWLPRLSKSRLTHLFERSSQLNIELITPSDASWPEGLNDLQDAAPAMLFVEGKQQALKSLASAVSIVGSRACTQYGLQVTDSLVRKLATANRQTVSGGALGIDARTHQASVENHLPTIAVMAGGLDRKYPRENFDLFEQVKLKGALISELPPGVAPTRWRFLQRNRLIAALSPVTVVVEAGYRSGSIRTANNALELDRELYAVPGPIFSNSSSGTNSLISQGKASALVDLELFVFGSSTSTYSDTESAVAKRARDAIREIGFPTKDEISKTAGLTVSELALALYELKTQNHVIESQGIDGKVHYALKYAQ